MDTKKYSIYRITNPNGKVYIGQSCNVKARIKWYKNCTPDQPAIYNSIKKYGYENHIFEILLENLDKEQVDINEKDLIKQYKLKRISLNISEGGTAIVNLPRYTKSVLQFTIDGLLIKRYDSLKDALFINNIDASTLISALKGENNYCKNYLWLYEKDYLSGKLPIVNKKYRFKISKTVYVFDINGSLLKECLSIKDASEYTGCCGRDIENNLKGRRYRLKRFLFSYEDSIRPYVNIKSRKVYQYDLDDNLINTFTSPQQAAEKLNVSYQVIRTILSRKCDTKFRKRKHSFILKYK